MKLSHSRPSRAGFTIVELIVVVAVLAILAAITMVSYRFVMQDARASTLKNDLATAAKQLEQKRDGHKNYPESVGDLRRSDGTEFQYTIGDGTYCLTATNAKIPGKAFHITEAKGVSDGACTGHSTTIVTDATMVVTANGFACALSNDTVFCWGSNTSGQLGNGSTTDSSIPVKVGGALAGKKVTQISAGTTHACALAEGNVYCWGGNTYGEVTGGESSGAVPAPTRVQGALAGKVVSSVKASASATCALADGQVYCWGTNLYGGIGAGTPAGGGAYAPTRVLGELSSRQVTALVGEGYTAAPCALASGDLYCWGYNYSGQLNADTQNVLAPIAMKGDFASGSVSVGISSVYNVCGIISGGGVKCTGYAAPLQLQGQTATDLPVSLPVELTSGVSVLSASIGGGCAVITGETYCWGSQYSGALGNGIDSSTTSPPSKVLPPVAGKNVTALSTTGNSTCAIASKKVYCWGANTSGQLGDGTTENRSTPVQVKPFPF